MLDEFVRRASAGDREAFDSLASARIDRLYAIARRVLRDPTGAEDAVQDCLVRAWRDLRGLREPARFDAWLYRLLLNACRDELRRARRRPVQVSSVGLEPADRTDGFTRVDERDQLERGFQMLSPEHRMALVLHHYLGLRPAEVANVLGVPLGTATSRLHYGARSLRRALEGELSPRSVGSGGEP